MLRKAAKQLPNARYLEMASAIARHHHERFDGRGYPDGLAGTDIPLAARICALSDVFDALTSTRPYRGPVSVSEATLIIVKGNGTQFDPEVVQAFQSRLDDIQVAYSRFQQAMVPERKSTDQRPSGVIGCDSSRSGELQLSGK
jgi:putative two-component system response regulator